MERWSENTAVVGHDKQFTYQEILSRIRFWQRELELRGIGSGKVVAIEGDYSPNTCALLLALIKAHSIVVPLTTAVKSHKQEFLTTAEAQVLYTFDDQDNWSLKQLGLSIDNPLSLKLIKMDAPGLVLFSSGSTGKRKAALHNFEKILEKFKIPRHRMCTINFLLFDHIGGINTLFYTLSNGGMVVTTLSRNPEKICRLIEKYKIELLPTTPTFLNLLLISETYKDFDLSSLKLITYGTEVMPESVLKKLADTFPDARLLQTYGLSELGILRSKSKSSDSLWVKVGGKGFETKVVDGILWIRADSAMVGYLNRPNPFTENGWFITGDEVEVDGDYLKIRGRRSEVINVAGEKVYPVEVESVLQMMEGVEDVTVASEQNPILGQIVMAKVKLANKEGRGEFRSRMRKFCQNKIPNYKIPQKVILETKEMHSERFKKIRQ